MIFRAFDLNFCNTAFGYFHQLSEFFGYSLFANVCLRARRLKMPHNALRSNVKSADCVADIEFSANGPDSLTEFRLNLVAAVFSSVMLADLCWEFSKSL
jgi:hypothetical protein